MVYIAAKLAKELHKGQVDKTGADYFCGHLCDVARLGENHLEQTVGFLHDAAEDTEITVTGIITKLKSGIDEWIKHPGQQEWIEEFMEILRAKPNDIPNDLSKE